MLGLRCMDCDRPFRTPQIRGEIGGAMARMLAIRCPVCGGGRIGMGEGRSLDEDRAMRERTPDDGSSVEDRLAEWLESGEVGNSALSLASAATGRPREMDAPHDADDLRRCILLLDRIPEWRETAPAAAAERSPETWEGLAAEWASLVGTFLEETNGTGRGRATATYARIDALRGEAS